MGQLLPSASTPSHALCTFQVLAISDFVVVVMGAMMYALSEIWLEYDLEYAPFVKPWILPILQMSMLTSVYATIVLSFERHIRIGHTRSFKAMRYITEGNQR